MQYITHQNLDPKSGFFYLIIMSRRERGDQEKV
jgi:hypothetical protein